MGQASIGQTSTARGGIAGGVVDRRTKRTRTALRLAFVDLLLERGYEQVTVGDLVERANVGRSTFYAHYSGVEALLKQALTNPSEPLAGLVDGTVSAATVAPQLEHFRDQRHRNRAFFTAPIKTLWARRLAEMIEPRLEALARARPPAAPALPQSLPLALVALQVADGQIALVTNWLSGRAAIPAATVARALADGTRATVSALLFQETL
jgi:AcrR family transcriptional regulator